MIADVKPYPQMKDSGVPWLGEVPEHWEVRRLKHAFRKIVGGSTPASTEPTYWDGDVVWVTPADISRTARLATSLRRITSEGLRSCSSELVPPGSIVVTSRAPVGNVAIAETELCTNQGCKALVATAAVVNPVFGFHVLTTLKGELQSLAAGTTFTEISTSRLCAVAIPLPPLPEQAAIVRFLDHADRRIRRYIRAKQKLIKLLEEQKQAIIHRAVTRGLNPNVRLKPSGVEWLGDVPEHWEVLTLRRVITRAVDGPHHSPRYLGSGIPFLSARNIKADRWSLGNAKYISEADYAEFSKRVVPEMGDVLYTKGGTTGVARAVDLNFRFQVWVHVAVLKVKRHKVQPEYLALVLNSPRCYEQAQLLTRGATNQDLGLGRMKGIVLALPQLSEQEELLRAIEERTRGLNDAAEKARREIELLRECRVRLIADVVTGKLDVREAAARLPQEAEGLEPLDEAEVEGDAEESGDVDGVTEEAEA